MKNGYVSFLALLVAACQTPLPLNSKYSVPENERADYVDLGIQNSRSFGITSDYLVKSSLKRQGEMADIDVIANFEEPKAVNGVLEMSQLTRFQFDCKSGRQFRLLKYKTFTETFAKGKLLQDKDFLESGDGVWYTINGANRADKILKMACYTLKSDADQPKKR